MTLPLGLKNIVNEDQVNWLIKASPDDLAPQLSTIVKELLYEEARHLREKGILFIRSTVPTETFKKILEELFRALHDNRELVKWLNLDMGSGKTHLLTLILYLLYAYDTLREDLEEYQKLGLNRDIAERTAILAIDLRTPSEVPRTFLRFFAKSLEKVKEYDASQYVNNCLDKGETPIASEIVRRLRRDTRVVIIVDELHHAILTYRDTESERKWVKESIDLVMQMINYLRHERRGFAVLVASARRDYERFLSLGIEDGLKIASENLLSQLGRLEPVLETRWLSVEEARQIVLKRLGAKRDILHPLFDRFIERIIKAESDIPQAQHLRSLIKAIAVYTKNAIGSGHNIVTPVHFSGGVLDALFTGGESAGIVDRYRSVYDQISKEIESLDGMPQDVKYIALLIVNTIFTMSVSGRPEQLIETIKAYKQNRPTQLELLPAITEQDIRNLLSDLGVRDASKLNKAFDIISGLSYIHSVKLGNTYYYFVVPVVSIVPIFNKLIEVRYRSYLANREGMISNFISYLYDVVVKSSADNTHIKVVDSYSGLENATRGLDPNKMYIVIYAEPELVKHIEGSLRANPSRDLREIIRGWFSEKGRKDLVRWLEEQQRQNIAIVMPVVTEEVLKGIAIYNATKDATDIVIKNYLLEYKRGSKSLPEDVRKIIDIELEEINREIHRKAVDAVRSLIDAFSAAMSYAYIYRYVRHHGQLSHQVVLEEIGMKTGEVAIREHQLRVDRDTYEELAQKIESLKDNGVKNLVEMLAKNVKNSASFVDDVQKARTVILNYLKDSMIGSDTVEISTDMNIYMYGNTSLYIPPNIVKTVVESYPREEIEKSLGVNIEIVKDKENSWSLRKRISGKVEVKEELLKTSAVTQTKDMIAEALEELDRIKSGIITLAIEFNESSKSVIKQQLNVLRRYIKKIEVTTGSGSGS